MATELYDEILFDRKTYADLAAAPGPMIMATATDISTGSRIAFSQNEFDQICSDLRRCRSPARRRPRPPCRS